MTNEDIIKILNSFAIMGAVMDTDFEKVATEINKEPSVIQVKERQSMIHTTVGLYRDGSFKINGVKSERLASHIQYNLDNRPGRALFMDGICIHDGNLDVEKIVAFEEKLTSDMSYIRSEDTEPYQ